MSALLEIEDAFSEIDRLLVARIVPGITVGQAKELVEVILNVREARERVDEILAAQQPPRGETQ